MKLSAPIYVLKQRAKVLSRRQHIPLHRALDRIAREEGFRAWSLLAARAASPRPGGDLLATLKPGDLVLVAARPGQGKTLMTLELLISAMKQGHQAAFFTLDFTLADVHERFDSLGEDPSRFGDRLHVDDSDAVSADYVIRRLESAPAGTVVVIDYLQLLDQRRELPSLMDQVRALKAFARERGMIIVCLSQIDRKYDPARRPFPELDDVRLPNPLDLGLFDRTCFLNNGDAVFSAGS